MAFACANSLASAAAPRAVVSRPGVLFMCWPVGPAAVPVRGVPPLCRCAPSWCHSLIGHQEGGRG